MSKSGVYRSHFLRVMERDHDRTWHHVHEDCRMAMFNYLVHGWMPGGFLTAVLTNDLYRAAAQADCENIKRLAYVALWVQHALPSCCYGNAKIMKAWYERTDREREQILIDAGLLPTLFDVIRDPVDLI